MGLSGDNSSSFIGVRDLLWELDADLSTLRFSFPRLKQIIQAFFLCSCVYRLSTLSMLFCCFEKVKFHLISKILLMLTFDHPGNSIVHIFPKLENVYKILYLGEVFSTV